MANVEAIESAKQFLLSRVSEQAFAEEIALSDVEKRMFLFSEVSPTPDWEANEKFEAEYEDSEYEKKISKLLRHAYSRDVKDPAAKSAWQNCLKVLAKEDFYGLVMVDQAKIPRPKNLLAIIPKLDAPSICILLLQLGILALAFAVLLSRVGSTLLVSDGLKLGSFVFLAAAAWGLGELYRRSEIKRAAAAFENFNNNDARSGH
jgi:hypothetical protein